MDWLIVDNVRPYSGRYEFDIAGQEFTTREWGWIKRHSGYLPMTIEDGFAQADPELFCVFAAIAMRRAGRIEAREVADVFDRLADAPFGTTIRLEADTADVDDDDPFGASIQESSPPNTPTSGDDSKTNGAKSADVPKSSGTVVSATSAFPPQPSAS